MKVTEDSLKKPDVGKEAVPVVAKEPKEVKDADTLTFEGIYIYSYTWTFPVELILNCWICRY